MVCSSMRRAMAPLLRPDSVFDESVDAPNAKRRLKTSDTRERMDEGIADFGTPGICDGCAWSEAYLAAADAIRPTPEP